MLMFQRVFVQTQCLLACATCDDFGHSNFDSLLSLLDDLKNEGVLADSHPQFVKVCREYQKFLKVKFSKQVQVQCLLCL